MKNRPTKPKLRDDIILDFAKKNELRAVVIHWKDDSDWNCFRIERVSRKSIALTGMTNKDGDRHCGEFFWVRPNEILTISLRR